MKWESRSCWFVLQQALLRSWRLWQNKKRERESKRERKKRRKEKGIVARSPLLSTLRSQARRKSPVSIYCQNNGYFAYISPKNMTFVYDFSLLKKKWTVLRTVYHTIAGLHVTSHGSYVGGQEQKHFSPLETKLYFHVNSSRKNTIVLTPNMAALSCSCKPRIYLSPIHSDRLTKHIAK